MKQCAQHDGRAEKQLGRQGDLRGQGKPEEGETPEGGSLVEGIKGGQVRGDGAWKLEQSIGSGRSQHVRKDPTGTEESCGQGEDRERAGVGHEPLAGVPGGNIQADRQGEVERDHEVQGHPYEFKDGYAPDQQGDGHDGEGTQQAVGGSQGCGQEFAQNDVVPAQLGEEKKPQGAFPSFRTDRVRGQRGTSKQAADKGEVRQECKNLAAIDESGAKSIGGPEGHECDHANNESRDQAPEEGFGASGGDQEFAFGYWEHGDGIGLPERAIPHN